MSSNDAATYNTTAISITHLKEALIYFHYVIPVNLVLEAVREGQLAKVPAEEFRLESFLPPKALVSEMLPPHLSENAYFRERLNKANNATRDVYVKSHLGNKEDREIANGVATWMLGRVISEFNLENAPVVVLPDMVKPDSSERADVAISLVSMKLVDTENVSWEQLLEFRKDLSARNGLRRLRLFAFENYAGKSEDFIKDDILTRISDYDDAVRKWGFETKSGVITALIDSKIVQGGAVMSGLAALCHQPLAAIASSAVPLAIQLGRIALDIRRQQFALRGVMRNNPVSYIVKANEILSCKP
jgi:hypothetical protein